MSWTRTIWTQTPRLVTPCPIVLPLGPPRLLLVSPVLRLKPLVLEPSTLPLPCIVRALSLPLHKGGCDCRPSLTPCMLALVYLPVPLLILLLRGSVALLGSVLLTVLLSCPIPLLILLVLVFRR